MNNRRYGQYFPRFFTMGASISGKDEAGIRLVWWQFFQGLQGQCVYFNPSEMGKNTSSPSIIGRFR